MAGKKEIKPLSNKSARSRAGDDPTPVGEPEAVYSRPRRAMAYLGGRALGQPATAVKEEQDLIQLIKKGLPRKSLDYLMLNTGLTTTEIAASIHTSDRTLRRYKPSKLLNPQQSERVIELARLYTRGEDVFDSADAFKEWMDSHVLSLGNRRPKEFLDTSIGIELLMDTLGRIEQGVFA